MPINLTPVNPIVTTEWDVAVAKSLSPQFFHQSCWLKALVDTYNFKLLCFMCDDRNTIPLVVVKTLRGKKKAVALPFSDGCDIRCNDSGPDELVSKLRSIAKKEKIDRLEFRGVEHFKPSGKPSHSYFGHRLQLIKDEKKIWKNLASSKQRNIRKAQNENITVKFYNDMESVREYYRLHCITRKRHGLPPQPLRFFEAIYDNVLAKGLGEIGLVHTGKPSIAGAMYLFSKSEVLYKFGASDKSLQHMRANDLLMWEAITRYIQKGFASFSFGKTEPIHEGLLRFKEGFGAERVSLNDFCYDVNSGALIKEIPGVHGFHNAVFSRMPIPVLKFFGEILYKYSA